MTQIGKYLVVEQIGEGAMGVVYKATDPVLNRTVAVKVMSEGLAQDEALRERFLREAQSAGSMQHPNLVTIYDFGETDGHLFIAMEYIEGVDLEDLMGRAEPLPLPAKLDLMIDVLNGLSFAHRRGIIHRDIKPANIRVDQDGRGRIMDFGVARMETSNLTGTGTMMGTPNYMAPEQITGGALTPAADIWSVGAMLYEVLTNKKPFQADTLHRVLFKIVTDPPSELLVEVPGLPVALDEIVKKALAKDPAERYTSASDMANALAAVRAKIGTPRMSRTVSQRMSLDQGKPEKPQADGNGKNNQKLVLIGGVIGIALLAGAVGYFGNRSAATPAPSASVSASPQARPADSLSEASSAIAPPATPVTSAPAAPAARARDSVRLAVTPPATTSRPQGAATKTVARTPEPAAVRADTTRAISAPPLPAAAAQGTTATPTPAPIAAQSVNSTASAPAPASAPAQPPATPSRESEGPAIAAIVDAYARSIGTRQVAEVRRVYVGMTPPQAASWETFFGSVRSITAKLDVSSLEFSGSTAVARLTGAYEFVTRAGRNERQPATFQATFQRDGDRWTLQSVR